MYRRHDIIGFCVMAGERREALLTPPLLADAGGTSVSFTLLSVSGNTNPGLTSFLGLSGDSVIQKEFTELRPPIQCWAGHVRE